MKRFASLVCLTVIIYASLTGCMKKESFSDIPQIGFISFINVFDSGQYAIKGILAISYQDGNGDIGLNGSSDTLDPYQKNGPYYYNLVITYFEKQNGVFKENDPIIPFSARMPLFTPNDPNQPINGTILDTLTLNPHPVYDTVKFEVFIYDRALNKSNVVSTPEIILKRK
jgi:hypothetical protein